MQISQLECFLAVEEQGSMNLAAQALFCSQSKVSNSIKELEEELGKPLFVRTNKGAQLTSYGKDLVPYARNVITQIHQFKDMYHQNNAPKTLLRVCGNHFGFTTLAAVELYSRHQNEKLNITMRDCSRTECIELVSNGYAELAVIRIWDYQMSLINKQLKSQKLHFYPVAILPASIVVGPNNPLYSQKERTVSPADLNPFPTVVFDFAMNRPNVAIQEMFKDLKVGNVFSITDAASVNDILMSTDAYFLTCGSSMPGRNEIQNFKNCRVLELKDCDIKGYIGYIMKSDQTLSIYGKEYIDIISDYLETV